MSNDPTITIAEYSFKVWFRCCNVSVYFVVLVSLDAIKLASAGSTLTLKTHNYDTIIQFCTVALKCHAVFDVSI